MRSEVKSEVAVKSEIKSEAEVKFEIKSESADFTSAKREDSSASINAAGEAAAAAKPKKQPKSISHPPYNDMVTSAIKALANRRGSSKFAIKKYILARFRVEDNKKTNTNINLTLRRGIADGKLFTNRFHAGMFKIVEEKGESGKKAKGKAAAKKLAKGKAKPKKKVVALKKTPAEKTVKKLPEENLFVKIEQKFQPGCETTYMG